MTSTGDPGRVDSTPYWNPQGPWRVVKTHRTYSTRNHPKGTYSYMITLVCGHERHRKGSQGLPRKMRCFECRGKP